MGLDRETVSWSDLPLTAAAPGVPQFLRGGIVMPIPDTTLDGGTATWGADAAMAAHILLRDPVRAAFDARSLLGPTGALQ
jgi:hypothetical protein